MKKVLSLLLALALLLSLTGCGELLDALVTMPVQTELTDQNADALSISGTYTTKEDVALLRKSTAPHVKVKAAGGISSLDDAEEFIKLGADRLGTSRLVKLARETEQ